MGNLAIWLTPVWVLSLGVTAGAVILILLYGLLRLIPHQPAKAAVRLVLQSGLKWVAYLVLAYLVFQVLVGPFTAHLPLPWQQAVAWLHRYVTPGALVIFLLFGILWLVSRSAAEVSLRLVRESVLQWVSYLVIALVLFCLLAAPVMPVHQVLHSLRRIPNVGPQTVSVSVPARTEDLEVDIKFESDELQSYSLTSEQDLIVGVEKGKAYSSPLILVEGGEAYQWTPSAKRQRLFTGPVDRVFVTNESDAPAELTIATQTDVPLVQVRQIPIAAATILGIYGVYILLHLLFPGISTIALATSKEAVAQPIYLLAIIAGAFLLTLFIIIPYNTFGEDVKMYKDSSLMTIMVLAILVAVWTASVSVADEIEGRTALTLLSKPISRREFVIGKFLGITWATFLMFVILGAWMLVMVSYKVVYDARETSNPEPTWQLCSAEMIGIVPGLVLAFMEAVVLTAISVAISTRLPMLPNLVICGSIYALGHLGPLLAQSSVGQNEFVAFFGQLIALVLPVLDHYNVQAAVAGGVAVPLNYLAWAAVYCILYSAVMMLLALILFEDRDLA
jgi:ABC-type transport system involved in multi-copper enzyme maturation permease subunit